MIPVTNVTVVSATRATATLNIPEGAVSGSYSLSAIQGLGLPLTLPNAFTVTGGGGNTASLVSVSPASGVRGESVMLTIVGRNTSLLNHPILRCASNLAGRNANYCNRQCGS